MTKEKLFIDQKENFAGNFGEIIRSSGIFYVRQASDFQTTISLMNYWRFKRGLDVAVIASLRSMDGQLVKRQRLEFVEGEVINYRPAENEFEGSVEIEVFSLQNMVIPYAALMAIYEAKNSVTMVHSYGRSYSKFEVEDRKMITRGEESCWTLRDSKALTSFAIFHNGNRSYPSQKVELLVTNARGESRQAWIELNELRPYETVKIKPKAFISDLDEFLGGELGNAALSFDLGEGFTRMLVGHETVQGDEFQVTHSNFNYARHQTDMVQGADEAYLFMPPVDCREMNVIVYGNADPGQYEVKSPLGESYRFDGLKSLEFRPLSFDGPVRFRKEGGAIPSRIVTAVSGRRNSERLPFECSLGVTTKARPGKRLAWGVCAMSEALKSQLVVTTLSELYGKPAPTMPIEIRLFSAKSHTSLLQTIDVAALFARSSRWAFSDLFPEGVDFLQGELGYFSYYSEYPGFMVYSTLERENGSLTIEHAF